MYLFVQTANISGSLREREREREEREGGERGRERGRKGKRRRRGKRRKFQQGRSVCWRRLGGWEKKEKNTKVKITYLQKIRMLSVIKIIPMNKADTFEYLHIKIHENIVHFTRFNNAI